MRVLVVAAHPDDEILGVGGTVARRVIEGDTLALAVMCEGISARYAPERSHEVLAQSRRAAAILGVSTVIQRELPDQRLDTLPILEVIREVEAVIAEFRPEVVYTHFGGDVNRDHRILSEAVMVATRPYATPSVREVLQFETPSATEWGTSHLWPIFEPTVFVDIAATLERKIEAFLSYTAEVRPSPHPRSPDALRNRAAHWGSLVNKPAAEPFALVRSVR